MPNEDETFFERHFLYNVWMLNETRSRIEKGHEDLVIRNALIESFCINARALIDCFNGRKGADAKTFAKATYVPWRGGNSPDYLAQKISYQIAHLTYKRTTIDADKINRSVQQEIYKAVAAEIANLRKNLKKEFSLLWPTDLELPPEMPGIPSVSVPSATNIVSSVTSHSIQNEPLQVTSPSTGGKRGA